MLRFEGVVRDGVIVPDEPVTLKDGTRVSFEDVADIDEAAEPVLVTTFAERYAEFRGCLPADTPSDLSTQHEHYRLGTPKR